MKPFRSTATTFARAALLPALAYLLAMSSPAQAQSFCASDGQPQPLQLLERFINADCASCWAEPDTVKASPAQLALDWVVPGTKGDDAPLSTVARRDGLVRLQALRQSIPVKTQAAVRPVKPIRGATLRVSHGTAVADYVGASIELKPIPAAAKGRQWTAWLALVETLPAGTEGSTVERNLVRNLLQASFDGRKPVAKGEPKRFFEARSMNIAEGVKPERMRVIGWVEDDKGEVVAAAQSRCEVSGK